MSQSLLQSRGHGVWVLPCKKLADERYEKLGRHHEPIATLSILGLLAGSWGPLVIVLVIVVLILVALAVLMALIVPAILLVGVVGISIVVA